MPNSELAIVVRQCPQLTADTWPSEYDRKYSPRMLLAVLKCYAFTPYSLKDIIPRLAELVPKVCPEHVKDIPDNYLQNIPFSEHSIIMALNLDEMAMNVYHFCQQCKMEQYASQIVEIADDTEKDYDRQEVGDDGQIILYKGNTVRVQRAGLQIKTRQWLMERLSRKFAPKSETLSHNVNISASVTLPPPEDMEKMSPEELLKLLNP